MKSYVILKLGGSSITKKDQEYTSNPEVIQRTIEEIKESGCHPIIVHGGGSFGHPIAKKYNVKSGGSDQQPSDKPLSISLTRYYMDLLHNEFLHFSKEVGLHAISLPATGIFKHRKGETYSFHSESLIDSLELGLTPIFYGDVIFSDEFKYTIISGDTIIRLIIDNLQQKDMQISEVIFGSDVDGVFNHDPKTNPSAELIRSLTLNSIETVIEESSSSLFDDVTGGMRGKLIEIKSILKKNIDVKVVNILVPRRLYNAIKDQKFVGSLFTAN